MGKGGWGGRGSDATPPPTEGQKQVLSPAVEKWAAITIFVALFYGIPFFVAIFAVYT